MHLLPLARVVSMVQKSLSTIVDKLPIARVVSMEVQKSLCAMAHVTPRARGVDVCLQLETTLPNTPALTALNRRITALIIYKCRTVKPRRYWVYGGYGTYGT